MEGVGEQPLAVFGGTPHLISTCYSPTSPGPDRFFCLFVFWSGTKIFVNGQSVSNTSFTCHW